MHVSFLKDSYSSQTSFYQKIHLKFEIYSSGIIKFLDFFHTSKHLILLTIIYQNSVIFKWVVGRKIFLLNMPMWIFFNPIMYLHFRFDLLILAEVDEIKAKINKRINLKGLFKQCIKKKHRFILKYVKPTQLQRSQYKSL